jgi:hypothetical protein
VRNRNLLIFFYRESIVQHCELFSEDLTCKNILVTAFRPYFSLSNTKSGSVLFLLNTFVPHRNIFVINSYLFFYINNTIQTLDGAHDKFAQMSIIHMRKYLNVPIIILQNKPSYMLEKTRKN